MFDLTCECGNRLQVGKALIGKAARCDQCRRVVRFLAGPNQGCDGFHSRLTITAGPKRVGETIFLGGAEPLDVGKHAEGGLRLTGEQVSRAHGRLVPREGRWLVEDAGSTNGTFVNRQPISRHWLSPGDEVTIGDYRLRFQREGEAAAAVAGSEGDGAADEPLDDGTYDLSLLAASEQPALRPAPVAMADPTAEADTGSVEGGDGPICPSCERRLRAEAKICVSCGIKVRSGRPVIMAHGVNENQLHMNAESTLRVLSWIVPTGLYPIASEAYGGSRPYVTWAIAGLTTLFSLLYLIGGWTSGGALPPYSNLMLWAGDPAAQPQGLRDFATVLAYGEQGPGQFRWYQLITHAFLHAGPFHLAGNLLFLLVFGSRVNALIGNIATAVLYPLLAVAAAAAHMVSMQDQMPAPMLGASGAIMGLAGMYLVLFPIHKVYMAGWMRFLFTGFRLVWKVWPLRGFWVVLFFIAFDVIATLLAASDGVAHWAHLGGFIVGMIVAFGLLFARLVNARGGDLLSVVLGRYAWPLIGAPSRWHTTA